MHNEQSSAYFPFKYFPFSDGFSIHHYITIYIYLYTKSYHHMMPGHPAPLFRGWTHKQK